MAKAKRKAVASGRRIHWVAPATIVFALTAGILFALGHHLFYASLNGKEVQSDHLDLLGTHVSKQQFNITVGTIFSYLVNFFLGTALATAYAQVFWRALLRSHATLETWDTAFSANSNVFFLGKVWIWWQFPLLFVVLVVAWLMPLASTIPPGTLSIGTDKINPPPIEFRNVPNVDFSSLNYVADMQKAGDFQGDTESSNHQSQWQYSGPATNVQRIAEQVAQTGTILPITPPFSNASWELSFDGPALKCLPVSESTQATVRERLKSTARNGLCSLQGYIAWSQGESYKLPSNTSMSFEDSNSEGLGVNIVSFPHMMDLVPWTGGNGMVSAPYTKACYQNDGIDKPERFADSSMIQCQLQNATYHVRFDYVNGNQTITLNSDFINNDSIESIQHVQGLGSRYENEVMHHDIDCSVLAGGFEHIDPNDYCKIDTKILKTLSYQGIFHAFYNTINGSVTRGLADTTQTISTGVEKTVLVQTSELHFLTAPSGVYPVLNLQPLQDYILAGNLPTYQGLVTQTQSLRFGPLSDTIEKLFQNITVSMMSSQALQPNITSAFHPSPVAVTRRDVHNIYVYSSARLWIAYGIAILFATIAALIGIWAFVANGVSYSQDFSTVFRVARGASMSDDVKPEDIDGKDPLPKYLKQSKVWLGQVKMPEKNERAQSQDQTSEDSNEQPDAASPTTIERTATSS